MSGSILTSTLNVAKRQADYAIQIGTTPLRTRFGGEVAHHSARLMELVGRELVLDGGAEGSAPSAYTFFGISSEMERQPGFPSPEHIHALALADPFLRNLEGQASSAGVEAFLELVEGNEPLFVLLSGGAGVLASRWRALRRIMAEREAPSGVSKQADQVLTAECQSIPNGARAVVLTLAATHEAGLVMPLLLAHHLLTPSEYASALLAIHLPHRSIPEAAALREEFGLVPAIPDWTDAQRTFTTLQTHAWRAMEYVTCSRDAGLTPRGVLELIQGGEGERLEFKSTLRRNLRTGQKDPAIEHACLKSVAAFLNTGGGTLLVGVQDDGVICGVEADGFPSRDRFLLHFWDLVKGAFAQDITPYLRTHFEELEGGTVFVVFCLRSSSPIFLEQKNFGEEFFVRVGPSTEKLGIQETLRYIRARFG